MAKKIKIKSIINPSIYFLIIMGLFMLFGSKSWWPAFYYPVFFSWVFFLSALAIILPKYIFKADSKCKHESVILLRSAIALAVVLNALGELGLYQLYKFGIQYDKVIHFVNCFLFVIVLTSFIEIWYKLPLKQALKISLAFVLAGSLIWEALEFFSDLFFHTSEFGVYGHNKATDTIFDIIFDFLGVIASSLVLLNPRSSKKIIDEYCHLPIFTESDE